MAVMARNGGQTRYADRWASELREPLAAALRELQFSGLFDPRDSAVFQRLADEFKRTDR